MTHNVFSPAYGYGARYANRVMDQVKDVTTDYDKQELEDFLAGFRAVIDIRVVDLTRTER